MAITLPHPSFETMIITYTVVLVGITMINILRFALANTNKPMDQPVKISILLFNLLIYTYSLYGIYSLIKKPPHVVRTVPHKQFSVFAPDKPIEFEFDAPISFHQLIINTEPKLVGRWEYKRIIPFFPFGRHVRFVPTQTVYPETNVMIYLSNISSPWSNVYGGEYLLEYTASKIPHVVFQNPRNQATGVAYDTDVTFTLENAPAPNVYWHADIEPPEFFSLKTEGNIITLHFSEPLRQNTTYTINLYGTPVSYNVENREVSQWGARTLASTTTFTTVKPPLVASFYPQGETVLPKDSIEIHFDQAMESESISPRLEIQPEISGTFIWNAANTALSIKPHALALDTHYSVTLKEGIQAQNGGKLDTDVTYSFKTVGPITVTSSSPTTSDMNVSVNSAITITFNQPVHQESAQSRFSLMPHVPGTFSWKGNGMTYSPSSPLSFGTTYTYNVTSGIASVYGKESQTDFSKTFTTAAQEFSLKVPYYKQEESFTCNIAAARMLLAYRGVTMTEVQLKTVVGSAGVRGNGNPHVGYVTDYGTYWEPIITAVSQYRPYRFSKTWTIQDILTEVSQGNPVMMWGQNGWSHPHEISWTNPDGTTIYAINGMHSSVVRGFVGSVQNPTHIIINDPWRGVSTISKDEFLRRWSYFQAALIVD